MKISRLFIFLLSGALVAPVSADVTMRSKMKSGGFKGLGAFEGTTTRSVKGEMARENSDITYSGRLMRMVAPPKDAIRITRVDLDKVWEVLPSKKSYTERTISQQMKEAAERGTPESEKPGKPEAEQKPTHRIKKSEFTVKKTGQKKTINGFSTEENAIRLLIEVEEIATKQVTTYKFDTDVWSTPLTPALRKAMDEEAKFYRAYMNKLGLRLSPKDREMFNPVTVATMLGVTKDNAEDTLSQMKKKMESIDGFPIVTDSRWTVDEDPRVVAARKEAAAREKEADEDAGVDFSGGAKGAAGSLLGGFAKKKMKANQEKKAAENEAKPMFSTYHEVVAVDAAPVSTDNFEVPAGFKKSGG